MKQTIATTMTSSLLLIAILVLMPAQRTLAQTFASEPRTAYQSMRPAAYQDTRSTQQMTAPAVSFQSTGTLMGSGSTYSSRPAIGTNGVAYAPSTASSLRISRPRRGGEGEEEYDEYSGNAGTPGIQVQNPDQLPLGDALLPLLLFALAYASSRALSRR
ncbi:MAG: hypothetical protein IJ581_00060, partial [Paludibacteraceae bacterium]|nr:hypothetical protein [Paludibacteraceae bacterium]